jgi:hypothetical protein
MPGFDHELPAFTLPAPSARGERPNTSPTYSKRAPTIFRTVPSVCVIT